jgi:hypothetical protein
MAGAIRLTAKETITSILADIPFLFLPSFLFESIPVENHQRRHFDRLPSTEYISLIPLIKSFLINLIGYTAFTFLHSPGPPPPKISFQEGKE